MVVTVAVEHVAVDEGDELRDLAAEPFRRQREPRIADEALVVEQHRLRVLVARHEPDRRLAVDPRLAEHRILLAHPRESRVRVGAEGVAVEVVLAGRRRHAAMLLRLSSSYGRSFGPPPDR